MARSRLAEQNLALKIIPASLLSDQPIVIDNLPDIEDIKRSLEIIKSLGGLVDRQTDQCRIKPKPGNNDYSRRTS